MKARWVLLVALATSIWVVGFADPASADEFEVNSDRGENRFIVLDPAGPDVVVYPDGSVFYPTGSLTGSEKIVVLDSPEALPEEPSAEASGTHLLVSVTVPQPSAVLGAAVTAQAICNPRAWSAPPLGLGSVSSWSCAYVGTTTSVTANDTFAVSEGTNQMACGEGQGWYQGYNGSQFGTWSRWYGLGCTTSGGSTGGSVPWGNIIATPKFRAQSVTALPAFGYWWL